MSDTVPIALSLMSQPVFEYVPIFQSAVEVSSSASYKTNTFPSIQDMPAT